MMFKVLVLQALYGLSDDQAEFLISDRLSFMRFLGLGLRGQRPRCQDDLAVPRAAEPRPRRSTSCSRGSTGDAEKGYLAMGGQIIDATIVAAPRQRNTDGEKARIKEGKGRGTGRTTPPSSPRRTWTPVGR